MHDAACWRQIAGRMPVNDSSPPPLSLLSTHQLEALSGQLAPFRFLMVRWFSQYPDIVTLPETEPIICLTHGGTGLRMHRGRDRLSPGIETLRRRTLSSSTGANSAFTTTNNR